MSCAILHVLRGSLQAILDGVYPMDEEEVGRLLGQTDHLTTLVNDLRELSLAEAHQLTIEPEPVDLGILVKDVAAAFRPLAAAEKLITRRVARSAADCFCGSGACVRRCKTCSGMRCGIRRRVGTYC
ncbi:MAG: hypothetical protein R3C44_02305 [Chloroflexota bacterium]